MKSDFFKRKKPVEQNNSVKAHIHKHYFVQNKYEFELLDPEKFGEDIYKRVEYTYLMCNSPCNHVKKVIVKKELSLDEQ